VFLYPHNYDMSLSYISFTLYSPRDHVSRNELQGELEVNWNWNLLYYIKDINILEKDKRVPVL